MVFRYIILLSILIGPMAVAQSAITGFVNIENVNVWEQKVYLAKIGVGDSLERIKQVAWCPLTEDGSFSFHKRHLVDKDAVYRLYVNKVEKIIQDTVVNKQHFILSKSDVIHFPKAKKPFDIYQNSSAADAEWRKMQKYQEQLALHHQEEFNDIEGAEDTISKAYAVKLKSYTKDSLKILLVKLIGIKQLAQKGLLDTDIEENPDYYLALLNELEESDMQPMEYLFLSRRLAYLTQDVVEKKYERSKALNYLLGAVLLGILFVVYLLKKNRKVAKVPLSKQEQNIHALLLDGKSNKEIASTLFISVSTVKTHITSIYTKLNVANRGELLQRFSR